MPFIKRLPGNIMRKRISGALFYICLAFSLSACAAMSSAANSAVDKMPAPEEVVGTIIAVPIVAVAVPVVLAHEAEKKAKDKRLKNGSIPLPHETWSKKGLEDSDIDIAAMECGYRSLLQGYEPEIKTAAYADELAQRAACMEKAGFHYSFSASDTNSKNIILAGRKIYLMPAYAAIMRNIICLPAKKAQNCADRQNI